MEYLVTAEEMKRYDHAAIHELGIGSMVLMERAALAVTEAIKAWLSEHPECDRRVLILAGCGNNGADGLAIGRMLALSAKVEVVVVGNREYATDEWKQQYAILGKYPVKTGSRPSRDEYDVLVDAIFGVGLSREITGPYKEWIDYLNASEGWKVAVDVPSGIDADTGVVRGTAFRADLTVCFAFCKRGLAFYPGCLYAGEVQVKEIGIDEITFGELPPKMFCYEESVEVLLPERIPDGNKSTFGKVLIAAGSKNMAGAAVLCAGSCMRIGAGMVKVLSPAENRVILQSTLPEALYTDQMEEDLFDWADVLVVGPGLGQTEEAEGILEQFINRVNLPILIDADGLNLLSGRRDLQEQLTAQAKEGRTVILTPHVGELARLTGKTIAKIKEKPVEVAEKLAADWQVIVVSKDARTLIVRDGSPICLNLSGCDAMATAGSGDVLSGIIAGLLAQGVDGWKAACIGTYVHGKAGEAAAEQSNHYSVTALDLVEALKTWKGRKK